MRTGYTFTGWSPATFTNITANLTVTAQYSISSCTVQFVDYDGTTVLKTQSVNYGGSATAPTTSPTRTGYTFTGWSPATFTNITANLTVTAQYTAKTCTVTLDAQGGWFLFGTTNPKYYTYDSTYGTLPTPSKLFSQFKGWFTGTNGGGTKITATTTVTADITLYADW